MKAVAFATYRDGPDLTPGDLAVARALAPHHEGVALPWDGPIEDFLTVHAVVLRSCWNYHLRSAEFLAWMERLEAAGIPIWNAAAQVRWNSDKRYLAELSDAGHVVVETEWLQGGQEVDLGALLKTRGWDRAVVKPVVSASAYRTWVATPERVEEEPGALAKLLSGGAVMVQPFVDEVVRDGEWSLVFFDGVFSHAVLKRAQPGDFRVQQDFGGSVEPGQPPSAAITAAQNLVSELDEIPLYARVDGVLVEGRFVLMELELIEPELFVDLAPGADARFADAIRRRLEGPVYSPRST